MEDSKLIQLVKTFSKTEFNDFGKFVKSPFFNESQKLILLYELLKENYPVFNSGLFNNRKIFELLYPEEKKYVSKSTESLDLKITEGLPENKNSKEALPQGAGQDQMTNLKPTLELPDDFSWLAMRSQVLFGGGLFVFIGMLGLFLNSYLKISHGPQFKKVIDQKISLIQKSIDQKNDRKMGTESVNLIYMLLAQMAHEKKATSEWAQMISKVPQNYRNKYESALAEKFEYFQMIGFAPEEVKSQLIGQKPITGVFEQLKKLSFEIINDLPKV